MCISSGALRVCVDAALRVCVDADALRDGPNTARYSRENCPKNLSLDGRINDIHGPQESKLS